MVPESRPGKKEPMSLSLGKLKHVFPICSVICSLLQQMVIKHLQKTKDLAEKIRNKQVSLMLWNMHGSNGDKNRQANKHIISSSVKCHKAIHNRLRE